ncbi:TetR family transcriptional regulator [Streptomyces sp. NPDC048277]|uniref:TetR family transcriptional regulator n=1 Tax=Streptomyces sp. NPDC048277 TaxID=3155027 RepID=UPI0033CBEEAE
MSTPSGTTTRDIARAAIRAELAQVAFDLFRQKGFDNVTLDDLARAAGVSRSTYLRYFGTKEDAVLDTFDAMGDRVAEALRARPTEESHWTALRHGLDVALEPYRQDPAEALARTRLVRETPALSARQLQKQHSWRPILARALAERGQPVATRPAGSGSPGADHAALTHDVRAGAALECLNVALDAWTASEGRLDLVALLDEAFTALTLR